MFDNKVTEKVFTVVSIGNHLNSAHKKGRYEKRWPDQTAHSRSLIWLSFSFSTVDSIFGEQESPNRTAHMSRAFTVRLVPFLNDMSYVMK